ncbi:MAG: glycosyltransferase [Lachnospiraceae bacterium]|nr:glycosyltransferase [Lachnospiraceae bacterium]
MISIILPIYNTEEYLEKCLNSILAQTYQTWELIAVNDGSTDKSGEILDRYAAKDKRIHAIHQENGGESHARNVALRVAKGDYIAFVDCDDWLEPKMYEKMIQTAEYYKLDMVAAGWFKNDEIITNEKEVVMEPFGRDQLLYYLYKRDAFRGFSYMWNKLYRRNVLQDTDGSLMEFDESLRLGGDVIYLAKAALNVGRVKYISESFYHYRIRKNSGSHTTDFNSYRDWIKSYEITIDLYKRCSIENEIIDLLKRFLAYHAWEAAGVAITIGNDDELQYFQNVMLDYKDIYIKMNKAHPNWIKQYLERLEVRL